jgi:pimeloyl-ACP methyl ester carboxylesterase
MNMPFQMTGEGRPLVLVPGGLTGWLSWEPHAQRLSQARKVVRVQLLSVQYGLEGRELPPDYSPRTESKALAAAVDALGLSAPVDFAAWSYGGVVTLDYALAHPDRIRSLTLIEPPAFWVLGREDEWDAETREAVQSTRLHSSDITEDQLVEFARMAGLVPPDTDPRSMPQWPVWARHRQSLRANPAIAGHKDDPSRLRVFQPPVLLVKGTGSAPLLHQITDALARHLPNARVTEMPAGHGPHIVSVDKFLEEMADFQAQAAGVRQTRS